MSSTAERHQGAIEIFWLHFKGALISTIFIYSQWFALSHCKKLPYLWGQNAKSTRHVNHQVNVRWLG